MTTIDRRNFLRRGAVAGAGAAGLTALLTNSAAAKQAGRGNTPLQAPDNGGYGPLITNPAAPMLALPAGFSYVAFGQTGTPMSDGKPTPSAHDGMAAFPGTASQVILVRNHERSNGTPFTTPAYDSRASGGTTNVVYDTAAKKLVATYATLSGTIRNCAGGVTPWGSWISCEENFSILNKQHGYNFEVPASAKSAVDPIPLVEMGRFSHEAIAIDPASGIVYETEDAGGDSGFFRFIPKTPGKLVEGGKLQMLAIKAQPVYDTKTGQRVGKPLPVEWVDIDVPNPNGTDRKAVAKEGISKGAAIFGRLEGAWYGDGSVFFNSTSGGDAGSGQIWEYRPRGSSGGQLILVFESPGPEFLDSPDNITVSPRGGLSICEDGDGVQFVRGITPIGQVFDFVRNDLNEKEFAGGCYSPDGKTFFVNIQSPGITFAITGPFEKGDL